MRFTHSALLLAHEHIKQLLLLWGALPYDGGHSYATVLLWWSESNSENWICPSTYTWDWDLNSGLQAYPAGALPLPIGPFGWPLSTLFY